MILLRLIMWCVAVSLTATAAWLFVHQITPNLSPPRSPSWPKSAVTLAPAPQPLPPPGD